MTANPDQKRHPIQVVSRRSGLSVDVLRVWEKRYGLVTPARSESGRRLYSDSDVDKLRLIREATAGGRRVGRLARLSIEELEDLVREDRHEADVLRESRLDRIDQEVAQTHINECLRAVEALDGSVLKSAIERAIIALPPAVFLDHVATPLMHEVGDLWYDGKLTPGHEHLASSVLRNTMAEVTAALQPENASKRIVIATPSGQQHEIGAVLVAATAQLEGWSVTYLGPDLPPADIAKAALQVEAKAVALSITVLSGKSQLAKDLRLVRKSLPDDVALLVGGQAVSGFQKDLNIVGAHYIEGLPQVRAILRDLA